MKALIQTGSSLSACGHAQAGGRVSVPLKSDFLSITEELERAIISPAKQFVMPHDKIKAAIRSIEDELAERLAWFKEQNKILELQRLDQRTHFDLDMLRELGYCSGIENYSRHLGGRAPGTPTPSSSSAPPNCATKSANSATGWRSAPRRRPRRRRRRRSRRLQEEERTSPPCNSHCQTGPRFCTCRTCIAAADSPRTTRASCSPPSTSSRRRREVSPAPVALGLPPGSWRDFEALLEEV